MIISMIIVSIVLAVLIYTNAGSVGQAINPVLGGLVGVLKYFLPVALFFMSISMAKEKDGYLSTRISKYVIFIVAIASILHIYNFSHIDIANNATFEEIIQEAYDQGTGNKGGGAIGAIIATPLSKLLGSVGATVLCIGFAIVSAIYIMGLRPLDLILEALDRAEERKAYRKEEREAYAEERAERRSRRREELAKKAAASEKNKAAKHQMDDVDLIQDEIIINNFNEEKTPGKKGKFSLFKSKNFIDDDPQSLIENKLDLEEAELSGNKKSDNPNELNNIFKEVQEVKEEKTKEVLQLEHYTHTFDDENYEFPPIELLSMGEINSNRGSKRALTDIATKLQKTLYSFGVSAKVENVSVGPAITRYELKPAEGVRVSKIAKLADDIALNLAAESIRIEAPIPGKQAVGIEIPNKDKESVALRDLLESSEFGDASSKLAFAIGKNVAGECVVTDIAKMPHVLIAGSTGSGKSVCINTLIASILYKAKPSEVKLVMVDPKVVELSVYNGIPHLLIPVVTDPKKAAGALSWAVQEMVNRYSLFAEKGVRDIKGYNSIMDQEQTEGKLPQIVIIIDELADLMMVAPNDVEDAICRLAQMARAAGMHLVIATQRPSVDVITGIIKANIPSRIAFAVSSQVDSRTILDQAGAEKLLGKGDMLFYPSGVPKPIRLQGAFISDGEVEKIVDFLKRDGEVTYNDDILEKIEKANSSDKELAEGSADDEADPFLQEAIEAVIEIGSASASLIQRKFKVGYARAGRIIDQMEERGIISGYQGSKPREVLMSKERWAELKMAPSNNEPVGEAPQNEE
ncbi:MAG: DNA translocase FtsK [Clostridia bacterium]|nr:DNA translocase FtsK [Clostridia bacterium]